VPWEACSFEAPYSVIEKAEEGPQSVDCSSSCVLPLLDPHTSAGTFLYTQWVRASHAAVAPLPKNPLIARHQGSALFTSRGGLSC